MFFVGFASGTHAHVPGDLNMFILENQWNWNPIVVAPLVSEHAMLAQIGKQEVFNIQMITNTPGVSGRLCNPSSWAVGI